MLWNVYTKDPMAYKRNGKCSGTLEESTKIHIPQPRALPAPRGEGQNLEPYAVCVMVIQGNEELWEGLSIRSTSGR